MYHSTRKAATKPDAFKSLPLAGKGQKAESLELALTLEDTRVWHKYARSYVGHVVDDSGNGRALGSDPHAVIRQSGDEYRHSSVLVGWQCGFEPMFVACHSYLDVPLTDDEAEEMATDYLEEIGWFADGPTKPNFIVR